MNGVTIVMSRAFSGRFSLTGGQPRRSRLADKNPLAATVARRQFYATSSHVGRGWIAGHIGVRAAGGPVHRDHHGSGDGPVDRPAAWQRAGLRRRDRKSTRLNSSHVKISYAVFCLKKKKK